MLEAQVLFRRLLLPSAGERQLLPFLESIVVHISLVKAARTAVCERESSSWPGAVVDIIGVVREHYIVVSRGCVHVILESQLNCFFVKGASRPGTIVFIEFLHNLSKIVKLYFKF